MDRSYLSELEQLVMLAVAALGEDAYGARIRQALERRAKRKVSIATIYVALSRLERAGYVSSWLADPTPVRGGKGKRFYRVRPEGAAALNRARAVMDGMWRDAGPGLDPRRLG